MDRMRSAAWLTAGLLIAGCWAGTKEPPARTAGKADSSFQPPSVETDSSTPEWQLGPASSGPLNNRTSEADLRQHYGAASVQASRIQLGEGETSPGTVLYPTDSLRRAEIIWQDTLARQHPARVILRGNQSRWQVGRGVSLGTSLEELERLNGRPFTLAGFGWDYAGAVTDWNGGALDSPLAGVKLYLDPGPAQYESAPYSQVLGDRDYSSALPAMQQLNPRVTQIFVDFE